MNRGIHRVRAGLVACLGAAACGSVNRPPVEVVTDASFAALPARVVARTDEAFAIDLFHRLTTTGTSSSTFQVTSDDPGVAELSGTVLTAEGSVQSTPDGTVRFAFSPPVTEIHHRVVGSCGAEPGETILRVRSEAGDADLELPVRCVASETVSRAPGLLVANATRWAGSQDGFTKSNLGISAIVQLSDPDASTLASMTRVGDCLVWRDRPPVTDRDSTRTVTFTSDTQDVMLTVEEDRWTVDGLAPGPAWEDPEAELVLSFSPPEPAVTEVLNRPQPLDALSVQVDATHRDLRFDAADAPRVRMAVSGLSADGDAGWACDLPTPEAYEVDSQIRLPLMPDDLVPWFDDPWESFVALEVLVGPAWDTTLPGVLDLPLPVRTAELAQLEPTNVAPTADVGAPWAPGAALAVPEWFTGAVVVAGVRSPPSDASSDDPTPFSPSDLNNYGTYEVGMVNRSGDFWDAVLCRGTDQVGDTYFTVNANASCPGQVTVVYFVFDSQINRLRLDVVDAFRVLSASSGALERGAAEEGGDRVTNLRLDLPHVLTFDPPMMLTVTGQQSSSAIDLFVTVQAL